MFPLSCARACTHTGHETSAHKKTWSAHKCSLQRCFAHTSYTSFQIQMNSGKMLQKIFFMHTDFKKLEGTLPQSTSERAYSPSHIFSRLGWQHGGLWPNGD